MFGTDSRGCSLFFLKVNSLVDAFIDIILVFSEGVILTCLLLFGSAGILKVWTGLIVPPFRSWIRIQDQIRIRIRLQDGYMDQEHGSILPGEDPDPRPCHITPSNWK